MAGALQITELRCVAADDLALSPHCRRRTLAIHFTWLRDWPGVRAALRVVDAALEPFLPRPHMGKVFTLSPARVRAALDPEGLRKFRDLVRRCDPAGKFQNDWIATYVMADGGECSKAADETWYRNSHLDRLHS